MGAGLFSFAKVVCITETTGTFLRLPGGVSVDVLYCCKPGLESLQA